MPAALPLSSFKLPLLPHYKFPLFVIGTTTVLLVPLMGGPKEYRGEDTAQWVELLAGYLVV